MERTTRLDEPCRVLVCEDDDLVRGVTSEVLRMHGFHVLEARSGAEALDQISRSGPVHLLVTDVVMPRMSGPDLARRVRSAHETTCVLFVSGYPADFDALSREGAHGVSFLQKPYTPSTFLARVRALLETEA